MAGYSQTPLPKKLGIVEGSRLALVAAPDGFDDLLRPMPAGVERMSLRAKRIDLIVFFVTRRRRLEERLMPTARRLDPAGGLWVGWPKKASGVVTDITEDTVREIALPHGLVDSKVAALDETWSGLRLVVRKEHRAAWPK